MATDSSDIRTATEIRRPPAWLMIGTGILVVVVILVCARLAYGLILPPMREGLGLSYQQAGNLGTVTALAYLCLVMVAGWFAARWGGRRAVLLGIAFATTGFLGLSFASNYFVLMALMALLGFGTAFGYTPLVSLLSTWYPERRGTVIGALSSGVGVGMLISGSLVPYLTETFGDDGWRLVWRIFAIGGVAVAALTLAFLRNPPIRQPAGGAPPRPVDKAAVFRNRYVITVGLVYGVVGVTYIVQTIFMFSYAVEAGVPSLTAGRLAAGMGLLSIFAGPAWGWVSDRLGRGNALVLSMVMVLIGTFIPVIWQTTLGFAVHFLILGATVAGLFTSVLAASTEKVEAPEAPLAVSFVTLFFAAGQFLGPAIAGWLIEDWGFRVAFLFTCVVMVAGVYLANRVRVWSRLEAPAGAATQSGTD